MDIKHVYDPLYPLLATNGRRNSLYYFGSYWIMIGTFGSNLEVYMGYYIEKKLNIIWNGSKVRI